MHQLTMAQTSFVEPQSQTSSKVSHSRFTISIFKSRQHFMALSLGLFKHTSLGLLQLKEVLHRTKSPPISAVYTYDILQNKSPEAHGLVIVRFLSQLADLSKGKSISIALKDNLTQGQFLSEIRHSLTHKYKISSELIMKARQIIIKDLRTKYWQSIYQQMMEENLFEPERIKQEYLRIFKVQCPIAFQQRLIKCQDLQDVGNYEFHIKIPKLILQEISVEKFINFFQELTAFKKAITFSQLLKYYTKDYESKYYFTLIHKILEDKIIREESLQEKMIVNKLKKVRFNDWMEYNDHILKLIPPKILEIVNQPFKKAMEEGFDFFKA